MIIIEEVEYIDSMDNSMRKVEEDWGRLRKIEEDWGSEEWRMKPLSPQCMIEQRNVF
jgi:hypothetical protein